MRAYGTRGVGLAGATVMLLALAYIQVARPQPAPEGGKGSKGSKGKSQ